jgi:hypothetical protein
MPRNRLVVAGHESLLDSSQAPYPWVTILIFDSKFFALLLDGGATGQAPMQIFVLKRLRMVLPVREANRVTRFLKITGVTPCRVGRLIRSVYSWRQASFSSNYQRRRR